MTGLLLACVTAVLVMFGSELPRAVADPPEQELERLADRYAFTTCTQLARIPDTQGVNAAVGDVMDRSAIPRWAAQRVVWLAVKSSCPQYRPTVEQVVTPKALQPAT